MSTPAAQPAKEIFLEARELVGEPRARLLADACAGNDALRRRVEALLRAETALGSEYLSPAPQVAPALDEIDRYELLDVLGEGGFGTVFRAKRRAGVQTEIALKVLRAGLDHAGALARFGAEQHALETMDHPGIARVLDAGLTRTGRPYIAMELVHGEPITRFAERQRLSIDDRVALMAEVCRAVQHAHHKGVIHRDLKPSNILAWSSEGRHYVKVIDFGVAKAAGGAAAESPGVTRRMDVLGTPAYMSPEQARGAGAPGDVDTRADVYSLGAVLYELLCGQATIQTTQLLSASPGELERLICTVTPPAPSCVAALVKYRSRVWRELDWVTLKALEKDRARRYATAEALGSDLERVLRRAPVDAAPPSRVYRLTSLVRRHPGLFAGLFVALLAILVGSAVAVDQLVRARASARQAVQERQVAEAVNAFLRQDLLSAVSPWDAGTPGRGRDVTMRQVLDEASRRIDAAAAPGGSVEHQPLVQAAIHRTLSETYYDLGVFEPAELHARRWLTLARTHEGDNSAGAIEAQIRLAIIIKWAHEGEAEAEPMLLDAVERSSAARGADDATTLHAEDALATLYVGGSMYHPDRSVSLFRHVMEASARTLGPDHRHTIDATTKLSHALCCLDRYAEAESLLRANLERAERVFGPLSSSTDYCQLELARLVYAAKPERRSEVEALYRLVMDRRAEALGPTHPATILVIAEWGDTLLRWRRLSDAAGVFQRAQDRLVQAGSADSPLAVHCQSCLGEALARQGDYERAMPLLEGAVARMMAGGGDAMPDASWIRWRLETARKAQAKGSWDGL